MATIQHDDYIKCIKNYTNDQQIYPSLVQPVNKREVSPLIFEAKENNCNNLTARLGHLQNNNSKNNIILGKSSLSTGNYTGRKQVYNTKVNLFNNKFFNFLNFQISFKIVKDLLILFNFIKDILL